MKASDERPNAVSMDRWEADEWVISLAGSGSIGELVHEKDGRIIVNWLNDLLRRGYTITSPPAKEQSNG